MSLLFDALKRAQDSDDGVGQGNGGLAMERSEPAATVEGEGAGDSQFLDLSEPEVAPQPTANPAAVTPPVVNSAGAKPAPDLGVLAAQSIFSATARQSRQIVSLAVGGLAILLLVAGGGFWYYQRVIGSLVSHPAIVTPPPVPSDQAAQATAELAARCQLPSAEQKAPAAPNPASAGEIPPEKAPVPPDPATPQAATSPVQAVETVAAVASPAGADGHAVPMPAEKLASPPDPAEKTTANLVPLIVKPASGEGSAAKKVQAKRPRQPPKQSQPEKGDALAQPVQDNSAAASHIRLSASSDPLRDGYQALSEGRLDDAKRNYQEVVSKRPHERDALFGLAVIAHRQQRTEQATELYRQVLREDSGNATATAALVNLSVQVDPVAAESRLKQLLDQKPTSPELHHALGSVLARQKRWGEAQQEFFRAFTLEPENALFAYNLAVALDRLRQPAAALPYYEKSAQSVKPGDAAIDRDTIQRRVEELRSVSQEQH